MVDVWTRSLLVSSQCPVGGREIPRRGAFALASSLVRQRWNRRACDGPPSLRLPFSRRPSSPSLRGFPPSGSGVDQLRQGFPRSGAGCFGTCAQRPIVERRAPMFDPKVAGSLRAARRSAVPCGSAAAALPPGSQRAGRKGFGPWRRRPRRPLRAVGADDVLPCFRSSVSLV